MMVSNRLLGLSGSHRKSRSQPPAAKGVDGILSALNKKTETDHSSPRCSTVILNADSKLDYPASFAGKSRDVYLTGEGYFDIVHHRMPFIVHTGKVITRVLGPLLISRLIHQTRRSK